MASNGTSASDYKSPRYFLQWVTEHNMRESGAAQLQILGWCIRDQHTPEWSTVFQHTNKEVCEKLLIILNERT